jgi:hypothetical protein
VRKDALHPAVPCYSVAPTYGREPGLPQDTQVLKEVRRAVSDAACPSRVLAPDSKAQAKTEFKKIKDEVKKTEEEEARLVKIRK